jgi:hypothetical protein
MESEDKYFTHNEVTTLLSKKKQQICKRYALRSEEAVQHGTSISDAEAGIVLEE